MLRLRSCSLRHVKVPILWYSLTSEITEHPSRNFGCYMASDFLPQNHTKTDFAPSLLYLYCGQRCRSLAFDTVDVSLNVGFY